MDTRGRPPAPRTPGARSADPSASSLQPRPRTWTRATLGRGPAGPVPCIPLHGGDRQEAQTSAATSTGSTGTTEDLKPTTAAEPKPKGKAKGKPKGKTKAKAKGKAKASSKAKRKKVKGRKGPGRPAKGQGNGSAGKGTTISKDDETAVAGGNGAVTKKGMGKGKKRTGEEQTGGEVNKKTKIAEPSGTTISSDEGPAVAGGKSAVTKKGMGKGKKRTGEEQTGGAVNKKTKIAESVDAGGNTGGEQSETGHGAENDDGMQEEAEAGARDVYKARQWKKMMDCGQLHPTHKQAMDVLAAKNGGTMFLPPWHRPDSLREYIVNVGPTSFVFTECRPDRT